MLRRPRMLLAALLLGAARAERNCFLSLVVDCTLTVNGASQTPPGSGDVFEISGIKSPSSAGDAHRFP